MDADRQEWHRTFEGHEGKLSNGKRNDPSSQNDAIIDMLRWARRIVGTDFVKLEEMKRFMKSLSLATKEDLIEVCEQHRLECEVGKSSIWPKTLMELLSFVILIGSVCTTIYKILG